SGGAQTVCGDCERKVPCGQGKPGRCPQGPRGVISLVPTSSCLGTAPGNGGGDAEYVARSGYRITIGHGARTLSTSPRSDHRGSAPSGAERQAGDQSCRAGCTAERAVPCAGSASVLPGLQRGVPALPELSGQRRIRRLRGDEYPVCVLD